MILPQDPTVPAVTSNYRFVKPDASTLEFSASIEGLEYHRRSYRLMQPPGSYKTFVIGKDRGAPEPVRVSVLVTGDTFALAETEMRSLAAFARDATSIERYDPDTATVIATWTLPGSGRTLARLRPEAIQASHTSWRFDMYIWKTYVKFVAAAPSTENTYGAGMYGSGTYGG